MSARAEFDVFVEELSEAMLQELAVMDLGEKHGGLMDISDMISGNDDGGVEMEEPSAEDIGEGDGVMWAIGNEANDNANVNTPDSFPENIEASDSDPQQQMGALQAKRVKDQVWSSVQDSLCFDPSIVKTASILNSSKNDLVTINEKGNLEFQVMEHLFGIWKERHEAFIGVSFNSHHTLKPFSSKVTARSRDSKIEKASWFRQKFECNRRGRQEKAKRRTPLATEPTTPSNQSDNCSEKGVITYDATTAKVKVVRTRNRASIKCGCLSSFNAILKPLPPGSKLPTSRVYTIEYNWEHNHDLGGRTEIGTQSKSKAILDCIHAMYHDGMSIPTITELLTVYHSQYTRSIRGPSGTRLPVDQLIAYEDIYDLAYSINAKRMRREMEEFESAALWMEDLRQQGYFVYFDKDNHQYHGFSSPQQLEELVKWGDIICFDGSHHAYGKKKYLYTIVVKNGDTGLAVPVAFLLTSVDQPHSLVDWLSKLKAEVGSRFNINYEPNVVITDQGDTEIKAIRLLWPLKTRLFYCAWHVLQEWRRQLTVVNLNMGELSVNARRKRREELMASLRQILYAQSPQLAATLITTFLVKWVKLAPVFTDYFLRNYLSGEADRRRWMLCYRTGVSQAWIHTNNFIESWHNSLTRHFSRDKQHRRIDTVIFMLTSHTLPHYQDMWKLYNVQVDRMTRVQRKALQERFRAISYRDQELVKDPPPLLIQLPKTGEEDKAVLHIRSFTSPFVFYDVQVDWTAQSGLGVFSSCSCPEFLCSKLCCKHIALALVEFPGTRFTYLGHELEIEGNMEEDAYADQEGEGAKVIENHEPPEIPISDLDQADALVSNIVKLLDSADRRYGLSNAPEVLSLLKRAHELVEIGTKPDSAAEDLRRKRQLQPRHPEINI